jgi:hypothetical protein
VVMKQLFLLEAVLQSRSHKDLHHFGGAGVGAISRLFGSGSKADVQEKYIVKKCHKMYVTISSFFNSSLQIFKH